MPVQAAMTPPHDEKAERGVLGSMLRDAERAVPLVVGAGIVRGNLYFHSHQLVFTRLVELFNGQGECDLVSLWRAMHRRGELCELDAVCPSLWLADLCDDAAWHWQDMLPEPRGLAACVERVLYMSDRRDQIHAARVMLRDAMDGVHGPRPRLRVWREPVAV